MTKEELTKELERIQADVEDLRRLFKTNKDTMETSKIINSIEKDEIRKKIIQINQLAIPDQPDAYQRLEEIRKLLTPVNRYFMI